MTDRAIPSRVRRLRFKRRRYGLAFVCLTIAVVQLIFGPNYDAAIGWANAGYAWWLLDRYAWGRL